MCVCLCVEPLCGLHLYSDAIFEKHILSLISLICLFAVEEGGEAGEVDEGDAGGMDLEDLIERKDISADLDKSVAM